MIKGVLLNCFNTKKTVDSETHELPKTSDNSQTSDVAFTKVPPSKNPLKRLLNAIKDIFRKFSCGLRSPREESSLEKKGFSLKKIFFSDRAPEKLTDATKIKWDKQSEQHIASCRKELKKIYKLIETRREITQEECEKMDDRFKKENIFRLDNFNETSIIQELPISEYDFDQNTKDFLDELVPNGNKDCSQLVKDFEDKIDLYKIYTSNEDATKKMSLVEILFQAGYTKVATGIAFRNAKNHEKLQKLRDIMANFLENMPLDDFTPWKVHLIEMFVLLHGTTVKLLPHALEKARYSASEKINAENGNSLLMELIRLGHYTQVLWAMVPNVTDTNDIFIFMNKKRENAFDLIKKLIKENENINPQRVKQLEFLQKYLYGRDPHDFDKLKSSPDVLDGLTKLKNIRDTLIPPKVTASETTRLKSFSSSHKKFLLQSLSLAGVNLSTIHGSRFFGSAFFTFLDNRMLNAPHPHLQQYEVEDFKLLLEAFPQIYHTIGALEGESHLYDPLCASIYYNQLDVVQLLLKEKRPTQLFMWMNPLEYALKSRDPVDEDMYRVLLEHEKKEKNEKDYKKIVNDFFCTVIKAAEGEGTEQVRPEVKKAVFKLLLEEQFEFIDTDKALQVCSACNANELSQAIHQAIKDRTGTTSSNN